MFLSFPNDFFFGTSTSAGQIETAFDHQWKGLESKDGFIFSKTIDHELRREEDIEYIKQFGTVYRCSVDWSRLQRAAFAPLEQDIVEEYQTFFAHLNDEGIQIMMVLHHFCNPIWFEKTGGWKTEDSIAAFIDFTRQCIDCFGQYIFSWNTFNEPNVYAVAAFFTGDFPPHKKKLKLAKRVINNMAKTHVVVYKMLKEAFPEKTVGISLNTAYFKGTNILGVAAAKYIDWWYIKRTAKLFQLVDYWGLSYYTYMPLNPFPVSEIHRPGKLAKMKIPHDKMWGYYPEGLSKILKHFHKRFKKPIIITENGICSDDPKDRIKCIKDYLKVCHDAIKEGINIKGYIHWSTFDNFEWHLGPSYRFGLVNVNLYTKERTMTEAGRFYAQVCQERGVRI